MTNPTTLPPLPDWLDVEAGEIKGKHLWDAAEWLSGYRYMTPDGAFERIATWYVDAVYGWVPPHACIARWAGEDDARWAAIDRSIASVMPESDAVAMGFHPTTADATRALCTATPTQLYRALVNVAWDEWRAEYNKRREAEGGTT